MKIPFTDLQAQHKEIDAAMHNAINRTIKRCDFILGQDVAMFEKEFSVYCRSRYAVGVSSGTAALFLGLLSLGIGRQDEVIVPAFTYIATALAVSYTGARPVFVDIDERTYNMDAAKIRKAISKNTRAIMPVHLYGQPADMDQIMKIAKEYDLRVIEDAAQAHGAAVRLGSQGSKQAGSIGDIGCFSFYPTKNLGALGDGGMIVTDNEEIYKKLLMLRDYGRVSKYEHDIIGYNSRLDTIQAAILRLKLKKLDSWNNMRVQAAGKYNDLFKGLNGVITPYASEKTRHVYHVYALRTRKRDEVFTRLKEKGIGVIIHYPKPCHLQKAYADLGYKQGDFPVSEMVSRDIISLPMFPHLKLNQIKAVVGAVKEVLA